MKAVTCADFTPSVKALGADAERLGGRLRNWDVKRGQMGPENAIADRETLVGALGLPDSVGGQAV